ncbi:MAG TPA: signal peptidase II [Gemmatimonadales bacterium]|nr:signal peptidase II [Gemmatimonadales bacterium]
MDRRGSDPESAPLLAAVLPRAAHRLRHQARRGDAPPAGTRPPRVPGRAGAAHARLQPRRRHEPLARRALPGGLLAPGAHALLILGQLYRRTSPGDGLAAAGLALIASGALGNLLDRLRSPRGVVDFIDVGIGDMRFWTFNVADVGITCGAILLVLALQRAQEGETAAPIDSAGGRRP